ncbi:MAG: hypothetical protein A2W22_05815 [Candidatus Levybacteria bacterium RBG_16_35_11]|nr:MAG: hypothetical protein A2W22_05815 [Candidatus Levybacteria bacterium RBG_16_35_11]
MKKIIKKKIRKKKNLITNPKFWPFYFLIIAIATSFYFFILKDLPSPSKLSSSETPQSTKIYDRNGKLLFDIYREKDSTFVPLSEIPKDMQEATIAIEDRNFYSHGAIDIRGITRALYSIVFHKQIQGGSTLTQQLVKNSLLTSEQTITRKIKEIILAYASELLYSKNQVLEMYLNQTPYGGTAYGIEAASQTYFGKRAKDLDLAESTLLAGLPEAPTAYSPFGAHPELAKARQRQVLEAMVEEKYISSGQADKAYNETLVYKRFSNEIKAPHFVLYIKDLLIKKYGEKKVEEGGLKVITSLDLDLQNMAQATVSSHIDELSGFHVSNGASMITNPKTGEILAMVGSKDYFDEKIDGNVNVTLAERQPGSSIKPVNYATGLINGYTAATPFIDEKICFPQPGSRPYCPVNYDGKFHGVVQMRYALGNSFNIPAVKMLKLNGIPSLVATATAMGITTWKNPDNYGLSLTLGGGEVTMIDMTQAFGVFATGGYKINLQPILKVTDRTGKVLEQYTPPKSPIFGKKVLPTGVSFIISDILADNNARILEFGAGSELKIVDQVVSVKTGTTNDFRDNWTIGYTPSYVVASWVGNNDNTPMSGLVSGITGAAPIWHDIMSELLKNRSPEPTQRPSNVIQKVVCSSGYQSLGDQKDQCQGRFEYFIKGTEPFANYKVANEKIWVDKNTQAQAAPGQTENLELKEMQVITDATGDKYCLSCAHPSPSPTPTPTP